MKKLFVYYAALICCFCLASCSVNDEDIGLQKSEMAEDGWVPLNNGSFAEKTSSGYVLEGDILLSEEQIKGLTSPNTRSGFITQLSKRWPSGIIYYEVAPDFAKNAELQKAIDHYSNYTNISFYPKSKFTENYIEFVNSKETNSYVGMIGGKQIINVAVDWAAWYDIAHEIGHALGLIHEHTRYDRDSYIKVHWDNIPNDQQRNYNKWTTSNSGISNETTPFDYNSLMLYSSYTSGKYVIDPTKPVISHINGSPLSAGRVLSKEDMISINSLYNQIISIMGDGYCLLPCTATYEINSTIPLLSTITWSVYPEGAATILNGQGNKKIEVRINDSSIKSIKAKITYPVTGQVVIAEKNVHAALEPIVYDIDMFKYTQDNGQFTLRAITTDMNAVCSWSCEGAHQAEFGELTYPDDASFNEYPNLFKEIYFQVSDLYWITVSAQNSHGSSTFTKKFQINDGLPLFGFSLAPNPVKNSDSVTLLISDKNYRSAPLYTITIYQDNKVVLFLESSNSQNVLDVSSLPNGKYHVVVEKQGVKAEQELTINN